MKITKNWLKKNTVCSPGAKWFVRNFPVGGEIRIVCKKLLSEDHFDWAIWLITRKMTQKQCIFYGVHAAKLVLPIFEKEYPEDKRPREAIEMAKKVLKNDTEDNRSAAYAVYADSAATSAVKAVTFATFAASAAAFAAKAAYVNAYVVYEATEKEIKTKIINYGLGLLGGKK